jgi:methylmalonyl-CoA mutase
MDSRRETPVPDEGTAKGSHQDTDSRARLSPVRFVTAASLFDGHDASINVVRRILQSAGAEVIHLGHNRSAEDVAVAAVQEDAHAVAVSSYQGGHVEYFKYLIDLLRARGRDDIRVFGGGGGVIVAAEMKDLHDYGVARIYSPADGQALGLKGMIEDMIRRSARDLAQEAPLGLGALKEGEHAALARVITAIESGSLKPKLLEDIRILARRRRDVPVIGITGTGGAGKSSLNDEIVRRFRLYSGEPKIAIIAVDPTRKRTGGALLGDRIRMNAIDTPNVFMRSLATRGAAHEIPATLGDIVAACKAARFDLVIVETPGIGQADSGVVGLADLSLYVMTPEFGAASQLEKIEMLDHADIVVINKFDRRGAADALRDVQKQVQRNREAFARKPEDMPVFGAIASRFADPGVTSVYREILRQIEAKGLRKFPCAAPDLKIRHSEPGRAIVPPERVRYLAEVAETVRAWRKRGESQARLAREHQQLREARRMLAVAGKDAGALDPLIREREAAFEPQTRALLQDWPATHAAYRGTELTPAGRESRVNLKRKTLSGLEIPRVALPPYQDDGELLRWLWCENLPGRFPFTAGVFPFKREDEDPTRMFAGEGDPFRTNRRFKMLSEHSPATRLSTAFDSVTLYGFDPDRRPDIYGKVGNSGVSIATLDDMKALYDGFELCAPSTSVSMTINGPAPAILAMFFNTAIDQQAERFAQTQGRAPSPEERARIAQTVLENIRGTVQADILKEDQGQNTCIFSTEFALRMMADIQEYFIQRRVKNFYSVSISGYHIAEAGANPISQLAFTLANGFTYVETYLARGMKIDDFAPNLSFFFSYGMDPEYSVMGRVARRIWAVAMRDKYGADERSQRLKYHSQTSGRSLHAQEMAFNDIRTTLQALIATYDNCNSLHTNAFDEAITTPTDESVRRALAIQLVINREWGLAKNENPNQGSFIIDELTDLVEEAVFAEFERIAERGGVLGAMETGYQRAKIQEESLHYETLKHDGRLPIVGVNTFLNPSGESIPATPKLARSTDGEKESQIARLADFQRRHADESPAMLKHLQATATGGGNVFAALMDAVRCCSLGQITHALFEAGGQYRRNM